MKNNKRRYPDKRSLNLAIRERTVNSPSRILPIAAVLTVLILLFAKFAVADRLVSVSRAQAEVADLRQQLQALNGLNGDYDAVLDEYALYSSGWMSDEELFLVDRRSVFSLLESSVLPSANLRSLTMSENALTLDLTGLSLRDASDIVSRLKAREDVLNVNVYTAGSAGESALDQTRRGSCTMTITLTNGFTLPEAPAEGTDGAEGGDAA